MPRNHKKRPRRKRHYVHGVLMTGSPEDPGVIRVRSALHRLRKRGDARRVGLGVTGKPGRPSVLWAYGKEGTHKPCTCRYKQKSRGARWVLAAADPECAEHGPESVPAREESA